MGWGSLGGKAQRPDVLSANHVVPEIQFASHHRMGKNLSEFEDGGFGRNHVVFSLFSTQFLVYMYVFTYIHQSGIPL